MGLGGYMHCNSTVEWDFVLPHSLVTGVCGSARGGSFITAPLSDLCATGSATAVSDTGSWSWNCRGMNGGVNSAPCEAAILTGDAPGAPTAVNAIGGNTQAVVAFSAPDSSGDRPITGYTVLSSPAGGLDSSASTTALTHIVTGLTNGTAYSFTVVAQNDFGDGPASDPSNSVTPAWSLVAENFDSATVTPPALPAGWQTLSQLNSEGVWSTNAGSHYPAGISAHSSSNLVYFNGHSAGVNRSARLVTPSFSLAGVTGAKVSFWMYRDGDIAAWNMADTLDVYVSSPLSTPHMSGSEVKIGTTINRSRWYPPAVSTAGWYRYVFDIPGSFTGSSIYVMFLGYSSGGNDIHLDDISVAIPPGPPTSVHAAGGNAQATVTFIPPLSNGGSIITGYTVTANPAGGIDAQAGTTALSHTVTGLANGTAYTFTVITTNVTGSSLPSSASNSVIPADVPGAPVIGSAAPGNGSATVYFTQPVSNGGAAIDSYTVTSNPDNITASWTSGPITVPGLANGTVYTFTVTANNSAGTGLASGPSNSVTPLLSYDFPTIGGLPPATVTRGAAYAFTPTSSKAASFTIAGSIPPGLSFNAGTGTLSGTPTTSGDYADIVITAHNSVGYADLPGFDISVKLPLPTIHAIPDATGTVGTAYGFWIWTTDTTGVTVSGTVPPGLLVSATSDSNTWSLDWTPSAAGVYNDIIITAHNSEGLASLQSFTVTVKLSLPTITGHPSTIGMIGVPYSTFIPAATYATSFSFTGILPPGLNFDTSTGAISSTPTASGTYNNLIVTAINDEASTPLPAFTITIAPRIDSFTAAAPLGTARQYHTSTLLPNGRVLITGGVDAGYARLSSAELYDPASDSWSSAGSLRDARRDHTATLLKNGLVLVTGGYGISGILDSAELYDPTSNSWTTVHSMTYAHCSHTSTLLSDPDGSVLVVGGSDPDAGEFITIVERYDPSTDRWNTVSPMSEGRYGNTATLLPDGKVLVVGGDSANSAVLYDPDQDLWSTAETMNVPRYLHTATALSDGRVLVAGGVDRFGSDSSSAELYDPGSGIWSMTASMATVRQSSTATLLADGTVLITGGNADSSSSPLAFAEIYHPVGGSWNIAGFLATPRSSYTATLLPNGNVIVSGGSAGGDALAVTELYNYAYTIGTSAGPGGAISPVSALVSRGSTTSFTITPDAAYSISLVSGCSGSLSGSTYTTSAITSPCTVSASFALNQYTVTASAGPGGTISPSSALVGQGTTTTFIVSPDTGYTASVGGTCVGNLAGNVYTTNAITSSCTVSASFVLNQYMVTASAAGGAISPLSALVSHGGTTTFTITPNAGLHISLVSGCSGTLAGTTYTTGAVIAGCAVIATLTNNAPTAPTVDMPTASGEVGVLIPLLSVHAATDPDGDPVTYLYEVYSDAGLTTLVASAAGNTRWTVSPALNDNTTYYWRVQASDGYMNSNWTATADFFVNRANDAPGDPAVSSPANNTHVSSLTPVLTVTNATDKDKNDTITYDYQIATDGGFTDIVASVTDRPQGPTGTTSWTTAPALGEDTPYYWRSRAVDNHGAPSGWVSASFFVSTTNNGPAAPELVSPAASSEVTGLTPLACRRQRARP